MAVNNIMQQLIRSFPHGKEFYRADYQFGWTNANAQEGGIITDISQLLFDGWRLGVGQ